MGIGDQGCREIKQGAPPGEARISYKRLQRKRLTDHVGRVFSATDTNLRNRYLLIRQKSFSMPVAVGIMGAAPAGFGRSETRKVHERRSGGVK
ncbi:MAG: hypothetical protein NFW04_04710 [Candidatus Accumulibacter sp.]|uniref:hypothetical protein n=1 Tax=Accumulibacter sp. TaxID=2053492 RepID=UPI0025EC830E|nr:hypothetical protein [Accumulibacter sp.]MCM8597946.1 hypothetical protein [Accumulibacter sp.]